MDFTIRNANINGSNEPGLENASVTGNSDFSITDLLRRRNTDFTGQNLHFSSNSALSFRTPSFSRHTNFRNTGFSLETQNVPGNTSFRFRTSRIGANTTTSKPSTRSSYFSHNSRIDDSTSSDSVFKVPRPISYSTSTSRNVTSASSSRTSVSNNLSNKNTIMAVVEGRGQARGEIGIACMNLNTPNLTLCQFSDTQTYTKLIAKINIFRPYEILLPSTSCEGSGTQMYVQLEKEVSYATVIPIQRRLFNEVKGLAGIQSLVADEFGTIVRLVSHKYYCVAAAAALLKYAELFQNIVFATKSLKIEFQVSEKTCLIDSATAQHLELLINNQYQNSAQSLLGILNTCRTPLGIRLLRMNILQPPCDVKLIDQRLDCVEELMKNSTLVYGLQKSLSRLPVDLDLVIATMVQIPKVDNVRILEQRINYIIALKHTLQLSPFFLNDLENVENEYLKSLRVVFENPTHAVILEKINTVLSEESFVQKGTVNMRRQRCNAIKPGINGILDIARSAYDELMADVTCYIAELSEHYNMVIRLAENSSRGHYLQATISSRGETSPTLPDEFLQVRKHGNIISFTTEDLLGFKVRIHDMTKEIQNITSIMITELIARIRGHVGVLFHVSDAIANLDLVCSLANYSLILGPRGTRPKFSDTYTSIINGRHPILDWLSSNPIVPNGVDTNFMLITGPNMSGKTTYLKQVASLQLLSQVGCYIPAESATVRVVNSLFSRLGTGDCFESNASAFTLEMSEMSYILKNLTDNCLVIIDELCRSTSVEEGTSMSFAIAEALIKSKAFVLFATHHLFLTRLESMYLNVLNYKMETQEVQVETTLERANRSHFDKCSLKNTYTIQRGVTNIEYYGLKLANSSSYPKEVVDDAREIANKIIEQRQAPANSTNEIERKPTRRSLFLLTQQLILAAETLKSADTETMRTYLKTLQQDFLKNMCSPNEVQTNLVSSVNENEDDSSMTS